MAMRKYFNAWIRCSHGGLHLFLAVLWSFLYLAGGLCDGYERPQLGLCLKIVGFTGLILLILIDLIHRNLHASWEFLDLFKEMDHLPTKQIQYVNSFYMTLFLTVTTLLMLINFFAAGPLFARIAAWLRTLFSRSAPQTSPDLMDWAPSAPQAPALPAFPQAADPPAWARLLDRLLPVLAYIAAAVILLLWLRALLTALWRYIARPRDWDLDQRVCLKPVLFGRTDHASAPRSAAFRHGATYREKIRRRYRRQILRAARQKKMAPPQWAAPNELEHAVGLGDPGLHELYEKARYSQEACTREDWERL